MERAIWAGSRLPDVEGALGREVARRARELADEDFVSTLLESSVPKDAPSVTLRPQLKAELKSLRVPEDLVCEWLRRGKWLQGLEQRKLGRPPRSYRALEDDEIFAERLRKNPQSLLPLIERALLRARQFNIRGGGNPRHVGARTAARMLTAMMRKRCRTSKYGLVGALLLDAGIIETGCWQFVPTAPPSESWCKKSAPGKRQSCSQSLRCVLATERVKALLKRIARGRQGSRGNLASPT